MCLLRALGLVLVDGVGAGVAFAFLLVFPLDAGQVLLESSVHLLRRVHE